MFEIEVRRVVHRDRQIGIGLAPRIERRLALLRREVARAPAIGRLVPHDVDAAALILGQDTAQKMCIAVVPVGAQRVTKQYQLGHHATSRRASSPTISRYSAIYRRAIASREKPRAPCCAAEASCAPSPSSAITSRSAPR